MRQKKIVVSLMLAGVMLVGSLIPATVTNAGQRITTLDASTYEDAAYWYCPEKDVLTENSKLTFTEESNADTKFISRISMKPSDESSEFLVVDFSIKLKKIPQEESFVVGLGLQGMESALKEEGNVEISFTNDGGIKAGVSAYELKGTPTIVQEAKACGISANQEAKVTISISGDSTMKVVINGKTLCAEKIPVTGSGKVGFLQTGGCAAEVSQLKIMNYGYDRPENTNVSEDFEDGFDISKLKVSSTREVGGKLTRPAGVSVQEHEGNQILKFVNAAGYHLTTKYQYSNFEMTFDIPYMPKGSLYDTGVQFFASFGLSFGVSSSASATWAATDAAEKLLFTNQGKVSSDKLKAFEVTPEIHTYWKEGKPFTAKITVVDGNVTVGIKWTNEDKYETLANYKIETGSPKGYIRFCVPTYGSVGIDNIEITNLDDKPQLIETEYKNGLVSAVDAEYEPFERVYKPDESKDDRKRELSVYLLIPAGAVVSGILLSVALIIANGKKKGKEVDTNEEKVDKAN